MMVTIRVWKEERKDHVHMNAPVVLSEWWLRHVAPVWKKTVHNEGLLASSSSY